LPTQPPSSTLKRPADALIRRFHLGQVGTDTVETFLTKGYSLALCCRQCPRLIEWTPQDLLEKFGERTQVKIADIAARLSCAGDEGCGSKDVAVFPHLYDGPWSWTPPKR
jgi:hypothetical protein